METEIAELTDQALIEARATDLMSTLSDWMDGNARSCSWALQAEIDRRGLNDKVYALCGIWRSMDNPEAQQYRRSTDDDFPF